MKSKEVESTFSLNEVTEWQERTLGSVYFILFSLRNQTVEVGGTPGDVL